jgi:predicted Zn finger-like uncharacterized protein
MLIVCPKCETTYQITPESLGETGRSVRCLACDNLWFEQPPEGSTQEETATPGSIDPTRIRPPLDDVVAIGGAPAAKTEIPEKQREWADIVSGALPDQPAPPLAPLLDDGAGKFSRREAPGNIERFAAGRGAGSLPKPRRDLSQHALPVLICAMVLALICLVAARQQVVRVLPQTASLYAAIGLPVNLRGLTFENIQTSREIEDGVPFLVVEGEIVGTTARHTEVPRLRFAVTDGNGREIYAWTAQPSRNLLPPGETLPFRSRLASPPPDASGVTVRFFNRRDAQAGFM